MTHCGPWMNLLQSDYFMMMIDRNDIHQYQKCGMLFASAALSAIGNCVSVRLESHRETWLWQRARESKAELLGVGMNVKDPASGSTLSEIHVLAHFSQRRIHSQKWWNFVWRRCNFIAVCLKRSCGRRWHNRLYNTLFSACNVSWTASNTHASITRGERAKNTAETDDDSRCSIDYSIGGVYRE